jgi:citrate synthase
VSFLVQLLSATQEGNPEALLGGIEPAARQLIHVIAGAFAYLNREQPVVPHPGESIVDVLTRTVRRKLDADDRAILNAALTLSADHELAPATFATRIAASTGAHLHACVVSGLGAFDGPLTGLGADRMEDLVRNARNKRELLESLHLQLRQGRRLFGFNHPIYPKGDPRARYLIEAVRTNGRTTPKSRMLIEVIDELESGFNAYPSLPVGLVAVELSMDLPTGSAGALFLLGRIAGWVAHVQEQRRAGFLLRPRAKYFGMSAT